MALRWILILMLTASASACSPNGQFATDRNTASCLQLAHDYGESWEYKNIDDISSGFLKGTGSEKTVLSNFSKILQGCESTLAQGGYKAEAISLVNLRARIFQKYGAEEQKIFLKRTGGRKLCNRRDAELGLSLLSFLVEQGGEPQEECVYALFQRNMPITAMQVTSGGILATATWSPIPGRVIYLSKEHNLDRNLADGSKIPPGYFVYTGNRTYVSVVGPRTVHAFRRIDDPFKNLLFYDGF